MTESVYIIFNILSFRFEYIQGQRTKVFLSEGTLRWGKVLMGARFDGKIYAFQTAPHANCDSEYDIYHIRGLYSGLTVIHFTNRLCMVCIRTYLKNHQNTVFTPIKNSEKVCILA